MFMELIKKSISSVLWISIGVYGVLAIKNYYVSAILFSLGLFIVCTFDLNLFTGKCGFIFETKDYLNLFYILIINLVAGYIFGLIYGLASPDMRVVAMEKVSCWDFSFTFFIKSLLCGVIMYAAVRIFKEGSLVGIFVGIPMFILCGFQHCIANVIYMGFAGVFEPALLICVLGNFLGSLFAWYINPIKLKSVKNN